MIPNIQTRCLLYHVTPGVDGKFGGRSKKESVRESLRGWLFGVGFGEDGLFAGGGVELDGHLASFDVDKRETRVIEVLEPDGVAFGVASFLGFGTSAMHQKVGAAFLLEQLHVVVVSCKVEIDFAADFFFHKAFDRTATDKWNQGQSFVCPGISVCSV